MTTKAEIKTEMVRIQGKISGMWAVIHTNNFAISCYKKSKQDFNVAQYQKENIENRKEVEELTKKYNSLKRLLNRKSLSVNNTPKIIINSFKSQKINDSYEIKSNDNFDYDYQTIFNGAEK